MTRKDFLFLLGLGIATLFGAGGIIRQLSSHAATPFVALEPEDTTVSGSVRSIRDTTASGDKAVVFGRSIPPSTRDDLVLGTYKPSAATTGVVSGVSLQTVTTPTVFTQSGTASAPLIIQNTRFMNKVNINGCRYITFKNCEFKGIPSSVQAGNINAAITSTNSGNRFLRFEDCLIANQSPAGESYVGVQGAHNSTFLRCEFKNNGDHIAVVHSADVGQTNAHDTAMNLTVQGCFFHDLAYFSPEPTRSQADNASHCDCIQIRGGSNIVIQYNTFAAFLNPDIGAASSPSVDNTDTAGNTVHVQGNKYFPDMNATSCLMVSPHLAPFHDIYFESNWVDGGSYSINLAEFGNPNNLADSGFYIRHNKWGRSMRGGPSATVIASRRALSSGALINQGNTYEDNGAPADFTGNGGS